MTPNFWINYVLALAVVALLLAGLNAMVRGLARGRASAANRRRMVTVLESTALAPNVALHVVRVGSRYVMIGGSNANVSLLAELEPEDVGGWLARHRRPIGSSVRRSHRRGGATISSRST